MVLTAYTSFSLSKLVSNAFIIITISPAAGRSVLRVDDEHTVEPFVHVTLQGHGVAMKEVQAERLGVELIGERVARHHLLVLKGAIHFRRVPAVEVNRVRMRPLVDEGDAHVVPFSGADRRRRHLAVGGPRREEHSGRDLELAIDGKELVLAKPRAVGAKGFLVVAIAFGLGQVGEIPAAQIRIRVETLRRDLTYGAEFVGCVTGVRRGRRCRLLLR